jgi:HEAT repeat protein
MVEKPMAAYKNTEESLGHTRRLERNFLLQELTDDESFFLVCKALFHEDHEIAIGASLALGHVKDQRALPYLLRAVLTVDEKRAEAVIWALGELGDASALPFLQAALKARFVPKSTLLALSKIGSPTTVEVVLPYLEDHDEAIRLLAVKALSRVRLGHDVVLITTMSHAINARLIGETSRRIKLMLLVLKNLLDKAID